MTAALQSFEQLVQYLLDNKIPYRIDEPRQLVELPSQNASLPTNVFVRWEKHVPFLQIVQFMIEGVPAGRVRELETAIVRADNALEVGGFGFDHERLRCYYRLTIPVFPHDGINPSTLIQLVQGVVRTAEDYRDAFQKIVAGTPGEQIAAVYADVVAQRQARAAATS